MKFLLKLSSHVTKRDTPNTTFCRHFWSACYSPEAHQTQRQKRSFLIHYVQRQRYSAVSKGKIVRPLERSKKKKKINTWMSLSLIPNSYCTANIKGNIRKKRNNWLH